MIEFVAAAAIAVVIIICVVFRRKKKQGSESKSSELKRIVLEFAEEERQKADKELEQRKKRIGFKLKSYKTDVVCYRCYFSKLFQGGCVCSLYPQTRFSMDVNIGSTCDYFAPKGTPRSELKQP
ncbi:MAG: hypothetical protein GY841_15830 [FCB group bacterium]|nr:hypothetical protein [FCB group bacterium]